MSDSRMFGAAIVVAVITSTGLGCDRDRRVESSSASHAAVAEIADRMRDDGSGAPTAIGGGPREPGAGPVEPEEAIDPIVKARCARDASCGLVGDQGRWSSEDACVQVISDSYSDDLTSQDCPEGVDGKELAECVQASRAAACEQEIDVIGRVAECRYSQLCVGR